MLALVLFSFVGCVSRRIVPTTKDPASWGVEITWHGHSCFSFRDGWGHVVVIDPFDETVGYQPLNLFADELLITHDHFDHNNEKCVIPVDRQPFKVVDSTGTTHVGKLTFQGVLADHDSKGGRINGFTRMFIWKMGGLTLAHLGDIAQTDLTHAQKEALRGADVLFVPVGGFVTEDATGAWAIVKEIAPHAVFPMHYGRPEVRFYPLDSVEPFLKMFAPTQVHRFSGSTIRLSRQDLTDGTTVYVPDEAASTNLP